MLTYELTKNAKLLCLECLLAWALTFSYVFVSYTLSVY